MSYDYSLTESAMPAAKRLWEGRGARDLDWALAEYQADPNTPECDEHILQALLSFALDARDSLAIQTLVARGAELVPAAAENLNGAAADGDIAAVDELIALGADINFCNAGYAPLDSALESLCDADAVRMVALLVARGADIESRCHLNGTALHSAALWGKLAVVKFLLSQGAKVAVEDVDEETPRDLALGGACMRWEPAPREVYLEIAALLRGPEMAEHRGSGHPVEPERIAEATELLTFIEGRLARGEPCGDLPEVYLDELRLRIQAHERGDIRAYRLFLWYYGWRNALMEAGIIPVD